MDIRIERIEWKMVRIVFVPITSTTEDINNHGPI